jgi:hypothetical protein
MYKGRPLSPTSVPHPHFDQGLLIFEVVKMLGSTVLLLAAALALPTDARRVSRLTVDSTPTLTLPWGTWEGQPYGEDGEVRQVPLRQLKRE